MKDNLTSGLWWKAAVVRALRTALVIALPYVPVSAFGETPYITIGGAVALGFVASLLTSLAGITEATGVKVTWYFAITERVVKTVAQSLVAGIGTAALIQQVNWINIGGAAIAAGIGSLLLGVITNLPEADLPVAASVVIPSVTNVYGADTAPAVASVPVVASATVADPAPVADVAPAAPVAPAPVADPAPVAAPADAAPAAAPEVAQ